MHVTLHVDPFQSLALNVVPTKLGYVIVPLLIQWFKNTTLNEYILVRLFLRELQTMLTGFYFYLSAADRHISIMLRDTHLLPTTNYAENHGKFCSLS